MIKKKKEKMEKEVKAYVGDKTLKGAAKLSTPILKGVAFVTAGAASVALLFKGAKKIKGN